MAETGEKNEDRSFKGKINAASADYYPKDRFKDASTAKGKDYGIILIADHRIDERETPVRTFWISGFSAVGTYTSVIALWNEIRNFSVEIAPDEDGRFVLAIVRATFIKDSGSLERRASEKAKVVHLIRGSLPRKVVPPSGGARKIRPGAVAERTTPDDRLRKVLGLCRIQLRVDFEAHEQTLITLYEDLLPRFSDQEFSEKIAEFERSVAGTPKGTKERRAEGSSNANFRKLVSFLNKLFEVE